MTRRWLGYGFNGQMSIKGRQRWWRVWMGLWNGERGLHTAMLDRGEGTCWRV